MTNQIKTNSRERRMPGTPSSGNTVSGLLQSLSTHLKKENAKSLWPPDIFAAAASILQESGAYIELVHDWPPRSGRYKKHPRRWVSDVRNIGKRWRDACVRAGRPPQQVAKWWKTVLSNQQLRLDELGSHPVVCHALLQLCATADEACVGAGVPSEKRKDDEFQEDVRKHLELLGRGSSTLCKEVDRSRICVLPKLHTPTSGMTIRSISHHLAMIPSGDVQTHWYRPPTRPKRHSLNLLLIPWPYVSSPSHFSMSGRPLLRNLPKAYGFFTYTRRDSVESRKILCEKTKALLRNAKELVGNIDGVLFPELALSTAEYECLRDSVLGTEAFLLAGIRQPSAGNQPGRNFVVFELPFPDKLYKTLYEQSKHHRWLLDKRQIIQYGLGGVLDPRRSWWEHIKMEPRQLGFFAFRSWLTMCVLICEDIARQDPVAEILRAVGPNLVIALLMDGPQLPSRWPARYATVLADDPGSSILTFTSLGMTELSRPPRTSSSRVVALWKDASAGEPIPIELPAKGQAIVLSIAADHREEWTADGRSDGGKAGVPVLGGVHVILEEQIN